MLVYHGSNHCFKQFRIDKKLVNSQSTLDNEGLGIYFSTDRKVAESYGRYLYTIDLDESVVLDFRKRVVVHSYLTGMVRRASQAIKKPLCLREETLQNIEKYILQGSVAVSGIAEEVALSLDSEEDWYTKYTESERKKVLKELKAFEYNRLNIYLFPYNIKGCGVMKRLEARFYRIVNRERIR